MLYLCDLSSFSVGWCLCFVAKRSRTERWEWYRQHRCSQCQHVKGRRRRGL